MNEEVSVEHVGKKKMEIEPGKFVSLERLIAGKKIKMSEFRKNPSYKPPFSFSDAEKSWPVGSKGFVDVQHDAEEKVLYVASISAKEGEGVGSRLMHEVEKLAKKKGCKEIKYCLNNPENTKAVYMITKKGFKLPEWEKTKKKMKEKTLEYRKKL